VQPQALALLALYGFVLLALSLGRLQQMDTYVAGLASAAFRGTWHAHARAAWFTHKAAYLGFTWVAFGVMVARRRGSSWTELAPILVALAAGLILFEGCRLMFERTRPGEHLLNPAVNSFPSGHVANAMLCIVTTLRCIALRPRPSDPVRLAVLVAGSLFVAAVAFTRIYFGLHWSSDVLASLLFGLLFAAMLATWRDDLQRALRPMLVALALVYAAVVCHVRVRLPSPPPDRGPLTAADVGAIAIRR